MATKEGVLAKEPMMGIKFSLVGIELSQNQSQIRPNEIVAAVQRGLLASQLMGTATLREPIFNVTVTCPLDKLDIVTSIINQTRGEVLQTLPRNVNLYTVTAKVPVTEYAGFVHYLR